MRTNVTTKIFARLCVFLLYGTLPSLRAEKHSLYYIYTALSKPVDLPGIYQFSAMGLLDDRQIDSYNSEEQRKIPTQQWMKEKMQEDYWEKGTQSRKSKEQWFNVNVEILMKRMRHNESDLHVLQWRVGCEIEKQGDEVRVSKGIDEYSYDGENFLSFDEEASQWVAPVDEALPTKRKWDNVPILNQYTKGYLEKECVDWLNKFRDYADEEQRKASPPDVRVFARKSSDESKLKLTCLATGFYSKDVTMTVRKNHTSVCEEEVESTGIRPNHDGTFQLRKSVEINEDEKDEYDCFVSHRTFKSIIMKLGQVTEPLIAEASAGREKAGETSDSCVTVSPEKVIQTEKHSLYYIYTALSKPVDQPGIYQFSAMGLLDDRQIDSYNSEQQRKIPTQQWMKEKMQEDYWEKGTQSRKSKEQWFNVNVDILMKRMRHNESDRHVLQWRHGCEIEKQGDEVKFSKGISEYGFDGENFLSFDEEASQWVAPVDAALPTKRKWDNVPILNQYTKGYLEKECVDWLNKFRDYADEEQRKASPPDVRVFARKSSDESKLKLTCLATGFYSKDVTMTVRKNHTSVCEEEVESTGIRPNHDGTFQLRKSVEINEDEKDEYDCFVFHRTFKSIIMKLGQVTEPLIAEASAGREKAGETSDSCVTVSPEKVIQTEKHSLYYIYTALSKPVDLPGIYQFSAMGLLDDRQIDSYNSEEQRKIPTQQWMKEKMQEDYWEKGTQSRKSKEQWFNVNVEILMKRMRHNESDRHVLQWRHGCEIEKQGDEVKFSKGISEYGFDGENFLSFDEEASQWVAPVDEALPTKRKWDNVPILNQYTKGYLEKECVDWLNKFRDYADEEQRKASPPDVRVFARKSSDESKLKLTCLATGFYSKDVTMTVRKNHTSVCEEEVESTGIRPNHDGTFQLRKSVEINEDEKDEYDCFVFHRTFKSIIMKLGQVTEPLIAEASAGREKAGETSDSCVTVSPEKVIQTEKHSLYYIYTALSKPVDLPGIYQFSAMGLLDDRQIDSYNSEEQRKIPTQQWMKEKMQEDYWEKGTQSRKSKEQWFNVNVEILMKRMRHNESDRHVLQWRHGCEIEKQGDEVKFSKGISEYGFDGENFLSFDEEASQWVAPVDEALPTKRKWDNVPILNQYTKGYLEKECVDWLNKFRDYADEEQRKASPPDVRVFARKSSDESKLKLTCLATGFYSKDVTMTVRKNHTSVCEEEVESTGIRPNHDGTFQLRKSVEINEDEKDEYDCFVSHRTFKSIIMKLGQVTEPLIAEASAGREKAGETSDSCVTVSPEKVIQTEKHSLYYIYTALSKPVDQPGIYQFSAMGLLDDRQIDSYNSEEQRKIPTQQWMKEKMQEDYWEKGTQSRKSKEQWFNVNVEILMKRMRHNESGLHVFQWRHGCEVEQEGDEVKFSKGISEYGFDGVDFLSFNNKESQWLASVDAALPTKRKWDSVPILNQYTKGYLEKECVDWLNKFRDYGNGHLRNTSPPDVHVFANRSFRDKTKLKLTCLVSGFYPKDMTLVMRKYRTSLCENEVESTGIRPNHDETFQLRKSVEINEDEKAEYDCFVSHRTFKEPVIVQWDAVTA
ncbi:uncharacterized protein LOC132149684 isoform X1 [Carassius carassius]|uniref:uncharacterized protein LOC132149684 isoform X1 n=1 Tax=Carassius carassius TaxID=217509 RepID=UPI0028688168|nr:uncharacterized protein LOC132149684 isoform X1 [Carassius carassius]